MEGCASTGAGKFVTSQRGDRWQEKMDGQGLRRKIGKEDSFQGRVLQYTRTCLCLYALHFFILLEETDDLDYLLAFIIFTSLFIVILLLSTSS